MPRPPALPPTTVPATTAHPASPRADDALLTYKETSALLGIPIGSLYSMVFHKRIPVLRLGKRLIRFRRRDLEAWLDGCAVGVRNTKGR